MKNIISGKTKLVALIGSPIEHSKSPYIHNFGFNFLKINYKYLCFDIGHSNVKSAIDAMRCLNIRGYNVTMPYKEEVYKYLDEVSEEVKISQCVNTVVNDNGILKGYNTDGSGFLAALENAAVDITDKKVLIVGAGGTGKAIATAILLTGCRELKIFNRPSKNLDDAMRIFTDPENLEKFKAPVSLHSLDDSEAYYSALRNADMIINCTSVGFSENDDRSIVEDGFLKSSQIVFDVNYANKKTRLIRQAEEAGCVRIFRGDSLLLWQAVKCFKLFTGKKYPIAEFLDFSSYENNSNRLSKKGNVYLAGFMGTGKSTIARYISTMLDVELLDTDSIIERREGLTVDEIFKRYGEEYFRKLEENLISELSNDERDKIISCGGGILKNKYNALNMKKSGTIILLTADPEDVYERVMKQKNIKRPLLMDDKGKYSMNKITALMKEREETYFKYADIVVNTSEGDIQKTANRIISLLNRNS